MKDEQEGNSMRATGWQSMHMHVGLVERTPGLARKQAMAVNGLCNEIERRM